MRPGKNPILVLILNFIVGIAVSHNLVSAEHQDYYVEAISEIVGYGIIIGTSIVSLYQVWKTNHNSVAVPQQPVPPVVETPNTATEQKGETSSQTVLDTYRG